MSTEERRRSVGLPPRPFLYTLDQIATLLSMDLANLTRTYIYFENRSTGVKTGRKLLARNIAANPADPPDWRVSEGDLITWMRRCGFRYYERYST